MGGGGLGILIYLLACLLAWCSGARAGLGELLLRRVYISKVCGRGTWAVLR